MLSGSFFCPSTPAPSSSHRGALLLGVPQDARTSYIRDTGKVLHTVSWEPEPHHGGLKVNKAKLTFKALFFLFCRENIHFSLRKWKQSKAQQHLQCPPVLGENKSGVGVSGFLTKLEKKQWEALMLEGHCS